MIYKCECCNAIFSDPRVIAFSENLDGERGIDTFYEEDCPYCGSEWFSEVPDEG